MFSETYILFVDPESNEEEEKCLTKFLNISQTTNVVNTAKQSDLVRFGRIKNLGNLRNIYILGVAGIWR